MQMRWNPYVLLKGEHISQFYETHFTGTDKKVLYCMGKGFDSRMNIGLEKLLATYKNVELLLISYQEYSSSSRKYRGLAEKNEKALRNLYPGRIQEKLISTVGVNGRKKTHLDKEVSDLIDNTYITGYTDIFIDISSLPRGIYFSVVGKFLSLIDNITTLPVPNLFVVTAENAQLDLSIQEEGINDLRYTFGFGGGIELESQSLPIIWLPLVGENRTTHFTKANTHIQPSEICPILPFPSKNPRRSDDIFREYYELLFEVLSIEPQNIIYVPEQNPFEVYRTLVNTAINYNESLSELQGCKIVLSAFSSKLLSIGAILAAYEFKYMEGFNVGILNVDNQGYRINNIESFEAMGKESELFVSWLTGQPYN